MLSWEARAVEFFCVRGCFLVALSAAVGVGKNRERDGGWNNSEGDGMGGGDSPRREITSTFSGLYDALVGVRERGLGEEDKTITSAEFAIVASDAFRVLEGRVGRAALET